MAITITPNIQPTSAPSASTPASGLVLQAGQVITAQVVQVLGNDQVQIAIGNQTIDATTQVPLQAGESLQLQVSQTASGIGLAIVNAPSTTPSGQSAAGTANTSNAVVLAPTLAATLAANVTPGTATPASPLSPVETLAVTVAAQTAAAQQTSLAPLFADLAAAGGLPNLPPQVQQAVAQVLAQQTSFDPTLTGNAVKQAFQSSGIFLEASLASGSVLSPSGTPDLKAALIVLRQTLTSSLAAVNSATASVATTAASVQSATPAAVAPQAAVSAEATALPATSVDPALADAASVPASVSIAQPGAALATAASPQATPALKVVIEALPTPVTILAEAAVGTPALGSIPTSPSLLPQATAAPSEAAPTQNAAAAIVSEILDLANAIQALAPAATQVDAAARAAATSAALNLLQEVVQGAPVVAGAASSLVLENGQLLSLVPVAAGARSPAFGDQDFASSNLPPPPINGALPSAQPIAAATLSAHTPLSVALQHLLSDTDGAIARQTLLQIASLPGQADPSATRTDFAGPRWNFEIPFATPQGTAIAQFEISRDGSGREAQSAKATWRARFSLNVEPAGPVHALISLNGDRTSVRMWAERPATASQLRAGVSQLSQALSRAELKPGDIVIREGAPVPPVPAPAGHFLDRAS